MTAIISSVGSVALSAILLLVAVNNIAGAAVKSKQIAAIIWAVIAVECIAITAIAVVR